MILTALGTISINSNNTANTVTIATGAQAKTLTMGSTAGASGTTISGGSSDIALNSADQLFMDAGTNFSLDGIGASSNVTLTADGAADDLTISLAGAFDASLVLASAGTGADALSLSASAGGLTIDSSAALELNSSAGAINIGNDAVAQAINVGTGAAARTLTIGNATTTTGINFDTGTNGFDVDLLGVANFDGELVVIGGTADGDLAVDDGDLYVVDRFEVDSAARFDGSVSFFNSIAMLSDLDFTLAAAENIAIVSDPAADVAVTTFSLSVDGEDTIAGGDVSQYGMRLFNASNGADVDEAADALLVLDNEDANDPINFGIDFDLTGAGGFTFDISLQNAETIDNATNGTITLTAPTTLLSGDLTVTGGDINAAGEAASWTIIDNTASAFTLEDGTGGADFIAITTTNGSETMAFGHSTVDSITLTTDNDAATDVSIAGGLTVTPASNVAGLSVNSEATTANVVDLTYENTSGTIMDISSDTVTLSAALVGLTIDLQTNVSAGSEAFAHKGIQVLTPAITDSTDTNDTDSVMGISVTGGAIELNDTTANTIYSGLGVTTPNITLTAGASLMAIGSSVANGSITTGGTQAGFHMQGTGVGAGFLYGFNAATLTGGAGSEYAMNIAAGWDTDINAVTSLDIGIAGTNELYLDGNDFSPASDNDMDLGTTALGWNNMHMDSGAVINFESGQVTLTQSGADTLTLAGAADGTDLLVLTAGDILVSDGELTLSGGDMDITLDADADASITRSDVTAASSEEGLEINFSVAAAGGDGNDQYRALVLDVASGDHANNSDSTIALAIDDLASADAEGLELAITIGTQWDYGMLLSDDVGIAFGSQGPSDMVWETADANANALVVGLPEGDATDVTVFVIGDSTSRNADLGFFNGITDTTLALVSDDVSAYASFTVADSGNLTIETSDAASDISMTPVDDLLLVPGDDVNLTLVAAGNLVIDGATTASTAGVSGAVELNVTSSTNLNRALDIDAIHTSTGATSSFAADFSWNSSAVVTGAASQLGYGLKSTATKTGADDSNGTSTLYGVFSEATNTGRTDTGTVNTYGAWFDATG
ncbi:MAG: hypothetical protein AAB431_00550, partial [Patescibacteria group bacterium]